MDMYERILVGIEVLCSLSIWTGMSSEICNQ